MNLKRILPLLSALLIFAVRSAAQSPIYTFNVSADTATESNASVIVGYVKADVAPATADSVTIALTAGSARPTHMDTSSLFVIRFAAGADSVPFRIQLYDDTFPEYPEHLTYTLRNDGSAAGIGSDSVLNFVLLDNDLPATISFVLDTDSAWIDDGSHQICETVNNPNPFYVRFYTRTFDHVFTTSLGTFSAIGGFNYFYTWDTIYAPPGISTLCQTLTLVNDTNILPNKTLVVVLQNVDANTLIDSTSYFTIKNGNTFTTTDVSFDIGSLYIVRDTSLIVGIPITTVNPNHLPVSFFIDTPQFSSTSFFENTASYHFTFQNNTFSHGTGTWHDTIWVHILDDHLIFDTINATLSIRDARANISADTLFHITIIDPDTLVVSFKGAGFAHLKDDSIGYVQVYTSAPLSVPVIAYVSYLNGDAVAGVDFLWHDTLVTFPPNAFDTISLPVIMLKNHIHDGNKQINLQLTNASPSYVKYDIIQYTYTIIDDDSTALYPAGIISLDDMPDTKIYPNPFDDKLNIHAVPGIYDIVVINMMGEKAYQAKNQSGDIQISLNNLATGIYVIRISGDSGNIVKLMTKN